MHVLVRAALAGTDKPGVVTALLRLLRQLLPSLLSLPTYTTAATKLPLLLHVEPQAGGDGAASPIINTCTSSDGSCPSASNTAVAALRAWLALVCEWLDVLGQAEEREDTHTLRALLQGGVSAGGGGTGGVGAAGGVGHRPALPGGEVGSVAGGRVDVTASAQFNGAIELLLYPAAVMAYSQAGIGKEGGGGRRVSDTAQHGRTGEGACAASVGRREGGHHPAVVPRALLERVVDMCTRIIARVQASVTATTTAAATAAGAGNVAAMSKSLPMHTHMHYSHNPSHYQHHHAHQQQQQGVCPPQQQQQHQQQQQLAVSFVAPLMQRLLSDRKVVGGQIAKGGTSNGQGGTSASVKTEEGMEEECNVGCASGSSSSSRCQQECPTAWYMLVSRVTAEAVRAMEQQHQQQACECVPHAGGRGGSVLCQSLLSDRRIRRMVAPHRPAALAASGVSSGPGSSAHSTSASGGPNPALTGAAAAAAVAAGTGDLSAQHSKAAGRVGSSGVMGDVAGKGGLRMHAPMDDTQHVVSAVSEVVEEMGGPQVGGVGGERGRRGD